MKEFVFLVMASLLPFFAQAHPGHGVHDPQLLDATHPLWNNQTGMGIVVLLMIVAIAVLIKTR